ncbi:hypothetical protein BC939DRAFT_406884 [Gamsiella multidivaricata]|uniref:uncharacterized protein n=1 Tax=Gamsiella multidivaricata TaxID=101098 RepID=UPI00222114C1|nr:uncharacterized protein BC939DRAFT_406884 [Gamsiella multidivaricata]KAG0359442.1 hypothetical protein BGZ54_009958 [Gamsiella multidivaricata]KAI7830429.1 hypothetical protein BC939DRAFT_406884 [Gamsiella multidivaricata]
MTTTLDQTITALEISGDKCDADPPAALSLKADEEHPKSQPKTHADEDDADNANCQDNKGNAKNTGNSEDESEGGEQSSPGAAAEDDEEGGEEEEVDYETQRQRNILKNQQLMMELGLSPALLRKSSTVQTKPAKDGNFDDDDEYTEEPGQARKRMRVPKQSYQIIRTDAVQTRSSKRIRGEAAIQHNVDLEALEKGLVLNLNGKEKEEDQSSSVPPEKLGSYSKKIRWRGFKQTTGYTVEAEIPCAAAPLTLGSIATTIWDIGKLYTGKENRLRYWSGKGSLFRHPYPIGFKAEKYHFRDRYTMHIKEGPDGPIFIVESASGTVYEGNSPTLPWTKVCLDSYSKGTRISGPLFFGFSDPITQKMIEDLDGYQNWETVVAEVEAEEQARRQALLAKEDN